jgi:hypothetical protein
MNFINALGTKESPIFSKEKLNVSNPEELSLKQHLTSFFNGMTEMVQVSINYGIESIFM